MSWSPDIYASQQRPLNEYYSGMNSSMATKVWPSLVHIFSQAGWKIVDMGTGSGDAASQYAKMFTWSDIIGVDINPDSVEYCALTFSDQQNLSFSTGDVEDILFQPGSLDAILNSSTLHHVSSFNNYSKENIKRSIENQTTQLKDWGILFIRDFLIPSWNRDVILELSTQPRTCSCDNQDNSCTSKFCQMSDADLLIEFCQTSRSLHYIPWYPMMEIKWWRNWFKKYKVLDRYASEFVLRKDYRQSWEVELQEEYSYFTQEEFEQSFKENGMRILASYPYHNPWIVENRFKDKFFLYDENGHSIDYPPTNYIIIWQKVSESSEFGTSIIERSREILDSWDDTFLQRRSYMDSVTWEIWDITERPWEVEDIIPYSIDENTWEIRISMRFWAPRPILWIDNQSLDRKHYSGYASEPHSISTESTIQDIKQRTWIDNEAKGTRSWLTYYPSPWILWEVVSGKFIQYNDLPDQNELPKNSWFNYSGEARSIEINDVLRAYQTWTMPESRIEMNLYALLQSLWKQADEWIGENINLETIDVDETKIIQAKELHELPKDTRFEQSQISGDYIKHFRARFEEVLEVWDTIKSLWISNLEYIVPKNKSTNVVSALPVVKNKSDWEIYVGLEIQHFPTVQEKTGNSSLWTVPAYRLENEISSYTELEDFSKQNIGTAWLQKIGESYRSSIWVSPETVYPHIISELSKNSEIKYISLDVLLRNIEQIHDAHLLITIFRLQHILQSNKANFH